MRRLIRVDGRTYAIRTSSDRAGPEQPPEFRDEPDAVRFLRRATIDRWNRAAIRATVREAKVSDLVLNQDEGRIVRLAADAIVAGSVVVAPLFPREIVQASSEAAAGGKAVVEERKESELTWIGIELVGEDDQPIPDVRYEIELSDGTVREGTLDAEGRAQERGLDPGTCKIRFPELDRDAWEFLESRAG